MRTHTKVVVVALLAGGLLASGGSGLRCACADDGMRVAGVLDSCCSGSACCGGPSGESCRLDYAASGRVTDSASGAPIAGAAVSIDAEGPAGAVEPATTGADGTYALQASTPLTCNVDYCFFLRVTATGYESFSEHLGCTSAVLALHADVRLQAVPSATPSPSATAPPTPSASSTVPPTVTATSAATPVVDNATPRAAGSGCAVAPLSRLTPGAIVPLLLLLCVRSATRRATAGKTAAAAPEPAVR